MSPVFGAGACEYAAVSISHRRRASDRPAVEPNYRIVAIGVSGAAKASYVGGVTFSTGQETGALALARIGGTGHLLLYADMTLAIRADLIEFTD